MKYILPAILVLSSCATNDVSSNKVASSGPEQCSQVIPMVYITPGKIDEEEYRNDYFRFKFDVGTSGEVKNLELLDSDSDDYMKKQALRAMAKWRFKPLVKRGQVVEQRECEYNYIHANIG